MSLQGGNIVDYSDDLIIGHLFGDVLHDFVFSQPFAVLEHLRRNIVWMLTGEPWLGVDPLAAVAVADRASLDVTLRRHVFVHHLAFVSQRGCARPAAFYRWLLREVLCDPFDLLIRKTPGNSPHKGSRARLSET